MAGYLPRSILNTAVQRSTEHLDTVLFEVIYDPWPTPLVSGLADRIAVMHHGRLGAPVAPGVGGVRRVVQAVEEPLAGDQRVAAVAAPPATQGVAGAVAEGRDPAPP